MILTKPLSQKVFPSGHRTLNRRLPDVDSTYLFLFLCLGDGHQSDYCIGKADGVFANPKNTNSFLQCSGERTFCMPCATRDLVFSAASGRCENDNGSSGTTASPPDSGNGGGSGNAQPCKLYYFIYLIQLFRRFIIEYFVMLLCLSF